MIYFTTLPRLIISIEQKSIGQATARHYAIEIGFRSFSLIELFIRIRDRTYISLFYRIVTA